MSLECRIAADPGGWPLCSATPPAQVQALGCHRDELLIDQAHLEKKAAATAVQFLFRLPAAAHRALSMLAREELLHFERALRLLAARGIAFAPRVPSAYAERLKAACRRAMPGRLLDELLVAALIEARSRERMACLCAAFGADDAPFAAFYRDLAAAEARHQDVYVQLAVGQAGANAASARWRELAAHEAEVLAALPFSARLHGGTLPVERHGTRDG